MWAHAARRVKLADAQHNPKSSIDFVSRIISQGNQRGWMGDKTKGRIQCNHSDAENRNEKKRD